MKNFSNVLSLGLVGAIVGAVLGEFFPRLFNSGFVQSIGNSVSEPFSAYRNELAWKYALIGLAAGAVIGLLISLIQKR